MGESQEPTGNPVPNPPRLQCVTCRNCREKFYFDVGPVPTDATGRPIGRRSIFPVPSYNLTCPYCEVPNSVPIVSTPDS